MSKNFHKGQIRLCDFHDEKTPYVPTRERVEQAVKAEFGTRAELVEFEEGARNHFKGMMRGPFTETYYFVTYQLPDE